MSIIIKLIYKQVILHVSIVRQPYYEWLFISKRYFSVSFQIQGSELVQLVAVVQFIQSVFSKCLALQIAEVAVDKTKYISPDVEKEMRISPYLTQKTVGNRGSLFMSGKWIMFS